MNNVADSYPHGPARASLSLNDLSAAAFSSLENRILKSRRAFRQSSQRQTVHGGARPDGNHGITMLAEDERLDLGRRQLQFISDQRAKARGVEHCAQPIDLLPRQTKPLRG